MNSDLRLAEELRRAVDHLRTHGWRHDGRIGEPGSARCAAGAIYSAIGVDFFKDWGCAVAQHLHALGFTPRVVWAEDDLETIAHWNDAPGRTLDEVLDRLESTALALEIRAFAATQPSQVLVGV